MWQVPNAWWKICGGVTRCLLLLTTTTIYQDDNRYIMPHVINLTSKLRYWVVIIDWEEPTSHCTDLSLTFNEPKTHDIDLSITIKGDNSRQAKGTTKFNVNITSSARPHVIWRADGQPLPENIKWRPTSTPPRFELTFRRNFRIDGTTSIQLKLRKEGSLYKFLPSKKSKLIHLSSLLKSKDRWTDDILGNITF